MKKSLKKLLTMALCTAIVLSLFTVPAFAASVDTSKCDGNHDWKIKSSGTGYDCTYGKCSYAVETCSKCGLTRHTAVRNWETNKGDNAHSYTKYRYKTECSTNDAVWDYCTTCGHSEQVSPGGHDWKKGEIIGTLDCTGGGVQVETCICGATRQVKLPITGTHSWAEVTTESVEPTCTENGYTLWRCTVCGTERKDPISMTGHTWVPDDTDTCGGGRVCKVCGIKEAGSGHDFTGNYQHDSTNHWLVCRKCGATASTYPHEFAGDKCIQCGYVKPSNTQASCSHTWDLGGRTSSFTHKEICSKCGAERSVQCSEGSFLVPRQFCTEPQYCECGNKAKDGQKNHNLGTWRCTDDTHTHKCLNRDCQYGESETHSYATKQENGFNVLYCTVCKVEKSTGVPVGETTVQHSHTYGVWVSDGDSTHSRTCTVQGCTEKVTETHVLGPADCTGKATCSVCGATVKTTPGTTHVGGTKIVGEKAAQVGVPGYSGDTVCSGCNAVLVKGHETEALKPDHTHTYNIVKHDSTGHWHECECGDKGPVESHTGGQGTCSSLPKCVICGETYGTTVSYNHVGGTKLTNSRAAAVGVAGYTGDTCCAGCGAVLLKGSDIPALTESHTHSYTSKHDSAYHWQECSCGDKKDAAEHTFKDGVCTVCGEKEPEVVEKHVHSYSTEYKTDGTYHWHVCETCGLEADKKAHVVINGKCVECGMTEQQVTEKVQEENTAHQEEAAHHVEVAAAFSDVKTTSWYDVQDLQKVFDAGLMKGTGATSFSPNGTTTRDMMVTILARMSGADMSAATGSGWAKPGQAWASALEINKGFEDGSKDLTREELVIMMYRMVQKPETDTDLSKFADADKVTGESAAAFKWAVANGVVLGAGSGSKLYLNATKTITRAEIATIIARYTSK